MTSLSSDVILAPKGSEATCARPAARCYPQRGDAALDSMSEAAMQAALSEVLEGRPVRDLGSSGGVGAYCYDITVAYHCDPDILGPTKVENP